MAPKGFQHASGGIIIFRMEMNRGGMLDLLAYTKTLPPAFDIADASTQSRQPRGERAQLDRKQARGDTSAAFAEEGIL